MRDLVNVGEWIDISRGVIRVKAVLASVLDAVTRDSVWIGGAPYMHDLANASVWLQGLGAVLVVALGGFVGSIRPRTRPNLAFAAFALCFGGQFLLTNVTILAYDQPLIDGHPLLEAGRFVLRIGVVVAAVAVVLVFPAGLRRHEWRLLSAPAAISILMFAAGWPIVGTLARTPWGIASLGAFVAWAAILVGLQALTALRFRAATDARSAHQLTFLAGALVLYTGFTATAGFDGRNALSILSLDPSIRAFQVVDIVAHLIVTGLWLWAAARGPAPHMARNVALLTTGMMLLGVVHAAAGYTFGIGITRILTVAVLAYAIVRHQLLGIDLKVRWTISKSTIAAVFIAVFFIASEAAQQFFGDTLGSTYVGIAAAGMLVFAMAPLQRAAERLAEKAVPVGTPARGPAPPSEAHEDLRVAYRAAARDGRITHEEEVALARLATRLGLDAASVLEIRRDALDQAADDETEARRS